VQVIIKSMNFIYFINLLTSGVVPYRISNYRQDKELGETARLASGSACGGSNPPWRKELIPYDIRN
jgi:hypothetical protein